MTEIDNRETRTSASETVESHERPLLTFVLFAYNQERFVREAIEGAFSQTYQPLEIILSDDCSTDGTFEIMRDMAAAYDGPHRVRVVRTERNLGVTSHVLLRGREALGQIVVVAAGDDVSKPERCAFHVPIYRDSSVMGVSGAYDLIDQSGALIESNVNEPVVKIALKLQRSLFARLKFPYVVIQGSTASYRKQAFNLPCPPWDILFSEDNFMNLLIYAHGYRVAFTCQALVNYRKHSGALSNRDQHRGTLEDAEKTALKAASHDIQKIQVLLWISDHSYGDAIVDFTEIRKRISAAKDMERWPKTQFLSRFFSFVSSLVSGRFGIAKWKFARLFGEFPDYQPKKITMRLRPK